MIFSTVMNMTSLEREFDRIGEYHSVLAMEAARKMRRTCRKKQTGQEVCRHLKMMLASKPVTVSSIADLQITGRRTRDESYPNGLRPEDSEPQYQLGF